MLTLALDTATRWGRFAIADADGVLAYRPLNVGGSYADALLAVIGDTLADAGRARQDLAAVAVTCGPGSFTGVRIGVATAKALAWGLGCALHPVSTLAAMAAALLAEHPAVDLAVPALDARRGEIFAAVYHRDGGWVRTVAAPAAGTPDRWWGQVLAEVGDPDRPVYGGEGAALLLGQGPTLRPELAARGEPVLRLWSAAHPATAPATALAVARGLVAAADPFAVAPAYLRASDAELNRRLDCTPDLQGAEPEGHESRREPPR